MTHVTAALQGSRHFRHVMGRFTTGVAVLTAAGNGTVHASTVNSVTSVSLQPILLLVCVQQNGMSARLIRQHGNFGISILGEDQANVAQTLADRDRPTGWEQLSGIALLPGQTGVPLLQGAIAWVECTVDQIIPGGDHEIVLGLVRHFAEGRTATPLAFFQGRFGRFHSSPALG